MVNVFSTKLWIKTMYKFYEYNTQVYEILEKETQRNSPPPLGSTLLQKIDTIRYFGCHNSMFFTEIYMRSMVIQEVIYEYFYVNLLSVFIPTNV